MNLNLHLLRIFYHVVECQGFSKAADRLFISQSAVSKGIKEFENQLGLALIERGITGTKLNRGVKLTAHGEALFKHARGIFALERATLNDLRDRIELKQGRIIIGASTTVASYWLPQYLATFYKQHPNIELIIKVANTQNIHQQLLNCEIDLAIVEGFVEDDRIMLQTWQEEELNIITAPHINLMLEDLNQCVWLVREEGSGTYKVTEDMLKKLAITPKQRIRLASNEGIARAVAAGLGIAILPACMTEELVCLNKLKRFKHPLCPILTRTLYLLQLRARPLSPLAQAFINLL